MNYRPAACGWRTETGEISGRGVITGSRLIQPRRAGGVAVVDLTNGSRHDGLLSSDAVFGTLIPCADGWISQTEQSLQHLPFLDHVREAAMTRWTTHPSEDSAVELCHLDLQAGDPVAVRGDCSNYPPIEHVNSMRCHPGIAATIVAKKLRQSCDGAGSSGTGSRTSQSE